MRCHCTEVEQLRVENDLLREEVSRARAGKLEAETEAADAVAAQVTAVAELGEWKKIANELEDERERLALHANSSFDRLAEAKADLQVAQAKLAKIEQAAEPLLRMVEDAYEETCTPGRGCTGCELLLKAQKFREVLDA